MSAEMGPPPETEHHHHHHTGHRWLDATLAVSAVFISLMSLAARDDFGIVDLDARNFTPQETVLLQSGVARLTFRVCYCSVFDECPVLDTRKIPIRPVSIKACSVPGIPFGH